MELTDFSDPRDLLEKGYTVDQLQEASQILFFYSKNANTAIGMMRNQIETSVDVESIRQMTQKTLMDKTGGILPVPAKKTLPATIKREMVDGKIQRPVGKTKAGLMRLYFDSDGFYLHYRSPTRRPKNMEILDLDNGDQICTPKGFVPMEDNDGYYLVKDGKEVARIKMPEIT